MEFVLCSLYQPRPVGGSENSKMLVLLHLIFNIIRVTLYLWSQSIVGHSETWVLSLQVLYSPSPLGPARYPLFPAQQKRRERKCRTMGDVLCPKPGSSVLMSVLALARIGDAQEGSGLSEDLACLHYNPHVLECTPLFIICN